MYSKSFTDFCYHICVVWLQACKAFLPYRQYIVWKPSTTCILVRNKVPAHFSSCIKAHHSYHGSWLMATAPWLCQNFDLHNVSSVLIPLHLVQQLCLLCVYQNAAPVIKAGSCTTGCVQFTCIIPCLQAKLFKSPFRYVDQLQACVNAVYTYVVFTCCRVQTLLRWPCHFTRSRASVSTPGFSVPARLAQGAPGWLVPGFLGDGCGWEWRASGSSASCVKGCFQEQQRSTSQHESIPRRSGKVNGS